MFTIGGSSGIIIGNNIIDIALHDTYYIISHFHIVLSLGTIIAIFIGICNYQEYQMNYEWLNMTNNLIGYHIVILINGIMLTFIPMHILGFNTLPRRIYDFADTVN